MKQWPLGVGYKILHRNLTKSRGTKHLSENRRHIVSYSSSLTREGNHGSRPPSATNNWAAPSNRCEETKRPDLMACLPEVLKLIFEMNPTILLDSYNACLIECVFYSTWNVIRLVIVPTF